MCGVCCRDRTKFLVRLESCSESETSCLTLSLFWMSPDPEFDPTVNSVSSVLMATILSLFTSCSHWNSASSLLCVQCVCARTGLAAHLPSVLAASLVGWCEPGPDPGDFPCCSRLAVRHDSVRFTSHSRINSLDLICQELQAFDMQRSDRSWTRILSVVYVLPHMQR